VVCGLTLLPLKSELEEERALLREAQTRCAGVLGFGVWCLVVRVWGLVVGGWGVGL